MIRQGGYCSLSGNVLPRTGAVLARLGRAVREGLDAVVSFSGLLLRTAPVASAIFIVSNVVTGLATPVVVWALDGLITEVSGELVQPWRQVLPWLAALSTALMLRSGEEALSEYLANVIREKVDGELYRRALRRATELPLAAFERSTYYDKLETGMGAIRGRLVYVLGALSALIGAATGAAGLLLLFARAHWGIVAVLVGSLLLAGIVEARQSRYFVEVNYGSSPLRRAIGYWAGLLSGHKPAAEIRLFQLGRHFLDRWRAAFDAYLAEVHTARRRLVLQGFLAGAAQEVIRWVTTVAVLVLGMSGTIGIGAMVALLYGVGRFRDLADHFSWTVAELVDHWSHLKHLRAFLDLPVEADYAGTRPAPRPIREGVTFHDVSFTYPGSNRPAIQNVTLTLYPGQSVALVGENGAGKSTLARLLLGLYRPTEGFITVDGVPLHEIDPVLWRREASVVFQDYMRYPATVRENIAFGDVDLLREPPGQGEHPRILAAAKQSGVDEMVARLPDGFHTLLGKQFEGGAELSTGQWQRLALARAYVREAQIVVLDEPTAALDPKAEIEVYRQFQAAASGKCTVFISHRLGSARLADRIVVLKDGRIVETGTHDELIRRNGEYARMFRLQAGWYREDGVMTG